MTLDELKEEWKKDCEVDDIELDKSSLELPKLNGLLISASGVNDGICKLHLYPSVNSAAPHVSELSSTTHQPLWKIVRVSFPKRVFLP